MMDEKYSIIRFGRIRTYDKTTQTGTVLVSAEIVYNDATTLQGVTDKLLELDDVPIHTPSGGGWAMTMPISEGDTCLIFFSQVGYDHWLYEDKDRAGSIAGNPKPWLKRKFHHDDGLAIVGFNTIPRAITDYTLDGSQWRNKDATQHIHLKEDLSIEITSPTSLTVNAPSVTVNCDTADVIASASTTIDTPITTITGDTQIDGALNVDGIITGQLNISAGMNVTAGGGLAAGVPLTAGGFSAFAVGEITGANAILTGDITAINLNIVDVVASNDLTAAGVSLVGHMHEDSLGLPTTPPL